MGRSMQTEMFDAIIVGSGMAGLTAAAYLAKDKHRVLLLEKEASCGGLLGAFNVSGHFLDKGARGIIDSGIISPMLRQLGLKVDFLENPIMMRLGEDSMVFESKKSLEDFMSMLKRLFPDETANLDLIFKDIQTIMTHMDVLYGIENPLFLSKPYDMAYMGKTLLPWMFKFLFHIRKSKKYMQPVDEYLKSRTQNQALIDMISQHFFTKTPTFFALSYFTLYLQYHYPKGSTQAIVDAFLDLLKASEVEIKNLTEVVSIDPEAKMITTNTNQRFSYRQLVWTADTNKFYECLDIKNIKSLSLQRSLEDRKVFFKDKKGAESVLTVYMLTNLDAARFKDKNGPHGFYTPKLEGLSTVSLKTIQDAQGHFITDQKALFDWVKDYLAYNTFEISIPSLRDRSLSPESKSALIVSTLFDYALTQHIHTLGYYEAFTKLVANEMIRILDEGLWPDLSENVESTIVASPKTIFDRTYATQGSVTGWSFENKPFPAEFRFLSISRSVITPIDSIKQAGQFTFNPAGIPIAVLTGKLAADTVHKDLMKD